MNSFELMGATQILAAEGQQELARALFRAIGRFFGRMYRTTNHDVPNILLP